MKSKAYLLFVLILLLPASILSVSASTEEPQNELPIMQVLNGVDGVQEIPLKAIMDANNNIEVQEDYSIGPDNVVNVEQSKNLVLMPDQGTITKVEAIDTKLQEHDIYFADNLVKADLPKGSYILNVILQTENGNEYAFVTILVVLAPTQTLSEENTQRIIDAFNSRNIDVTIIFKDRNDDNDNEPHEEEPSICYFDQTQDECQPDENGNCPNDWPMNEDGNCHPGGRCPNVDGVPYERVDDDETGTCYSSEDTFHCPGSNAIVLDEDDCEIYEPDLVPPVEEEITTSDNDTSSAEEEEPEPEPETTDSEEVVEEIEQNENETEDN